MNLHILPRAKRLARIFWRLQFLAIAAATSLIALQPATAVADEVDAQRAQRPTLTGNWLATVTRPGLPDLLALQTYFADGNLIEESNSSAIRSLGHGSWKRLGNRQFSRSFVIFAFDASRNFTGHSERFHTIQVSADGQTFINLGGTLSRFDAAGNLVSTVEEPEGIEHGRRFSLDPPIVPGPR